MQHRINADYMHTLWSVKSAAYKKSDFMQRNCVCEIREWMIVCFVVKCKWKCRSCWIPLFSKCTIDPRLRYLLFKKFCKKSCAHNELSLGNKGHIEKLCYYFLPPFGQKCQLFLLYPWTDSIKSDSNFGQNLNQCDPLFHSLGVLQTNILRATWEVSLESSGV